MKASKQPLRSLNVKRRKKSLTGAMNITEKNSGCCDKAAEAGEVSESQNADMFLVPLAERVKLRRMTSLTCPSGGRKYVSAKAYGLAGKHKLTHHIKVGLTRLTEGRSLRNGKSHAADKSGGIEQRDEMVVNADPSKPCKMSDKLGKTTRASRRHSRLTSAFASRQTTEENSTAPFTKTEVATENSSECKSEIELGKGFESTSVRGKSKQISVPALEIARNASAAMSGTRHRSAVMFPGNKLRRTRSALKVRTSVCEPDHSASEDNVEGLPTLPEKLPSNADCFEDCRTLRNRRCQMPCLKSTASTPYQGSEQEAMPKLRQVKATAGRTNRRHERSGHVKEEVQDEHVTGNSHSTVAVDEVASVTVDKRAIDMSEDMPTLSSALSNMMPSNDSTSLEHRDGRMMPLLEPSSTRRVENFVPQLAVGSKRSPDDDGTRSKSIKFDVSSTGELSSVSEPERRKLSTRRTPRKKHVVGEDVAFKSDATRTAIVRSSTKVDNTHGINDTGCGNKSRVVTEPSAVSSAAFHPPIMGLDQRSFIPPGAPMVVGWYPMLGSYFPNTVCPPQLSRGCDMPVLQPARFGVMSLPRVNTTSSSEFCNQMNFPDSRGMGMSTSLPMFWPPFGTPVSTHMGTALPSTNIARTMLAPTSIHPGSAICPADQSAYSGTRTSVSNATISLHNSMVNFFPSSNNK